MNWGVIKPALEQLAALSGLPTKGNIAWSGEPEANQMAVGARLYMTVSSIQGAGWDIESDVYVDAAHAENVYLMGQRSFVWTIRCESPTAFADKDAVHYLDLIRIRMYRSSAMPIFDSANLAVLDFRPTIDVSFDDAEGRRVNAAAMDVIMGGVEWDQDTTPNAGQWINTVNYSSNKLTNPSGADTLTQVVTSVTGS